MRYAEMVSTPVPQSEPLNERQVKNNAGGYVFQLDCWKRLDRFLILGSDASTYYQSARALTRENAKCVEECYAKDPTRTVQRIVEISQAGRAAKNDAAIFALALGACYNVKDTGPARFQHAIVRQLALAHMYKVCRTGTHLFQFVTLVRALGRGWGSALKRAVADWYDEKPVDRVAFQVIKYRQRENYTHKRLLQTAHPKGDGTGITVITPKDKEPIQRGKLESASKRDTLYRWICGKQVPEQDLPEIITAHVRAMDTNLPKRQLIGLIKEHKLPWEAIPTSVTKDPDVWKAMLPDMGLTALMRNLGGLTQYEAIKPLSQELKLVTERLTNIDELKKARLHPFNILVAQAVYDKGHSDKGARSWKPIERISDALEAAYYLSFKAIEPTGKRTLLAIDVSGSMSSPLMNSPVRVCAGAAAMAMVTARAESDWHIFGFAQSFRDLKIKASDSLESVLKKTTDQNFGSTDCSLPMQYALKNKLDVDVFQVYTDNETWYGGIHPTKALETYRQRSGINAKLVVVGMTSTGFTIADPNDGGMLDVVGFDSAAPAVIADFARG